MKLSKIKNYIVQRFFTKYEEVTGRDIDEINSVIEQAFKYGMENYGFEFKHYEDFKENLREIEELGGKTFVVKYRKKIVGTISVKPKTVKKWYYKGDAYELCHLAVLPKYQRMGLGNHLVNLAKAEAKKQSLPIILATPEKNVGVIRFYEKRGFCKVRMFRSVEHYAVSFIWWCSEAPYTVEEIRAKYEKNALLCLMKNFEICNEVADKRLRKKWNNQFYSYLKDAPEELREDMIAKFKKKGTTPRRYMKRLERKKAEEQKA